MSQTEGISLRKATVADAARIAEIDAACFPGPEYANCIMDEADFAEALSHKRKSPAFVAMADGVAAGYVLLLRQRSKNPKEALFDIWSIAVDPAFQRRGIAAALLARAEEEMVARAAPKSAYATAEVHEDNKPSQRLFESFNYAAIGVQPDYYADGKAAVLLGKKLERVKGIEPS